MYRCWKPCLLGRICRKRNGHVNTGQMQLDVHGPSGPLSRPRSRRATTKLVEGGAELSID